MKHAAEGATFTDMSGVNWYREKLTEKSISSVVKGFDDKRDVVFPACKREEVGCRIFQIEMSEFESIHGLGDQLDIKNIREMRLHNETAWFSTELL